MILKVPTRAIFWFYENCEEWMIYEVIRLSSKGRWAAWRIGPTGASWISRRRSAKSCTWKEYFWASVLAGTTQLKSSSSKKDLVDNRLNNNLKDKEDKWHPGLTSEEYHQKVEGGVAPLHSTPAQRKKKQSVQVQHGTKNLVKGMEYKTGLFSESREISEGVLSVYINTWWKGKIKVGARLFSVMACDKTRSNVYKSNIVGSMWTQENTFFLPWIKTGTDCTEMLWDLRFQRTPKIQSALIRNTYIVLGHILTYHTNHPPVLNWERWTLSPLIKTAPLLFVWFFSFAFKEGKE